MNSVRNPLPVEDRDWVDELPPSQRLLVRQWLQDAPGAEIVIIEWFDSCQLASRENDGRRLGGSFGQDFYRRFIGELHALLCSKRRAEERATLLREFKPGQTSFVGAVSAALAPYLGTSSVMLAPAVAITLTVIGSAGLAAWCAAQQARDSDT